MTTILVIEDAESLRTLVSDHLELEGINVLAACNGREGLQQALVYKPDLIISDIMMPDIDGFDVLQSLRENPVTETIPVIFLTALSGREDMRRGMSLGADDYLIKPFSHPELMTAIKARLKRQAALTSAHTEKLERARNELMGMVTHELRTPLAAMTTVQEIISRQLGQLSQDELTDLLATFSAGSSRLTHLVEQIVFCSQLNAEALTRDMIRHTGALLRIWELMAGAVNLGKRFAHRQQNVNVKLDLRDSESVVRCHVPALKHVFAELISNALNFSPADGCITISQWITDRTVWVSIVDRGSGIPESQLEQAMQAFQQLDRETHEQQGIGLGLTLAHRLLAIHGGELQLNSVVGKGTQALVKLPAA
jgi:signal transduction histidine kinase